MSRVCLRVPGAAAGVVAAVILLFAGGAAGASSGTTSTPGPPTTSSAGGGLQQPLQIRSATLTQDGRQFVWRVQLAQPFFPGALARHQRSLCLLFERVASGTARGQVCVIGRATYSSEPRLVFANVTGTGAGPGQVITATVTRTSTSDLQASFVPAAVDLRYGPIRWQVISTLRSAACVPPTPSDADCSVLFPGRPRLLKLHTPVLVGCVPSGASLVYHGPTREHEIALTFDDGPWNQPPTADFVRVLEREHVPATFFEIGRQVALYDPGGVMERRMIADGDMIGDHTWSHPDMALLPASQQAFQLLQTASAIRRSTGGFTPCLWRPPGGAVSPSLVSLARSLGFLTIMWNVDPRDWALPGVGAIYSNVVSNARDGSIVIQHFGGGPRYETLTALPQEIATLRARGYRFVTVDQMLGLKLVYR